MEINLLLKLVAMKSFSLFFETNMVNFEKPLLTFISESSSTLLVADSASDAIHRLYIEWEAGILRIKFYMWRISIFNYKLAAG